MQVVANPEVGFEVIQRLWEEFVRSAIEENPAFFLEHKNGEDVASTFWFWMENFVLRDLGNVIE